MTEDALEIVAKRRVAKGEQIFAPYGRELVSNSNLLLTYGFAFQGNTADEVVLLFPPVEESDSEDKISLLQQLGLHKYYFSIFY